MSDDQQITICITMGLRPDLLERTIESLGPELRKLPIIAINDFGDAPTNRKFRQLCPHGKLINMRGQVGHMRAIDAIYGHVQTPYIFHLEDDWGFTRTDFLDDAMTLLNASDTFTAVVLRGLDDMGLREEKQALVQRETHAGVSMVRLDPTDDRWFGYTFNPHLARRALWLDLGGFSQFRGEMHVSRHFREAGRYCVTLDPGACGHIGKRTSTRKGQVQAG